MKKAAFVVAVGAFTLYAGAALAAGAPDGKTLFDAHCAACHKDGGNMIKPNKTLKKSDREANGVKSAKDMVKLMRKPGPGMTTFDTKTVSDKDAKAIADYVMKTF